MAKKYFYITLLMLCFVSASSVAQENKQQQNTIEGLSFYPNPVNSGKIYISSKSSSEKEITIFDVLVKKVLQSLISGKELNISSLSPGIYIIQIREGEATATRKLIIE